MRPETETFSQVQAEMLAIAQVLPGYRDMYGWLAERIEFLEMRQAALQGMFQPITSHEAEPVTRRAKALHRVAVSNGHKNSAGAAISKGQKSYWNNLTKKQRAARLSAMLAGRKTKAKAAKAANQ